MAMKVLVTLASGGLLVAACIEPAFWARGGFFEAGTDLPGWRLLVFGLLACPITIPWLANIAWVESLRCLWIGRPRRMALASTVAVVLAALPLWCLGQPRMQLQLGYWLWLSGMMVVAAAGLALTIVHNRRSGA
jgi:hypothetical protein